MKTGVLSLSVACVLSCSFAHADVITTYFSRPVFEAAAGGSLTVEDFTSDAHFPISSGILNSSTNIPSIGLFPGDIKPGVTYSTPTAGRSGFFFNIDAGGGYVGGFLDGLNVDGVEGNNATLTATFDAPVRAFGFDTTQLMGPTFDLRIGFSAGPDYVQSFSVAPTVDMQFYGFISDQEDVLYAQITGSEIAFDYALDNFTFGGDVPEPSSLSIMMLLGLGCIASPVARRRRSR